MLLRRIHLPRSMRHRGNIAAHDGQLESGQLRREGWASLHSSCRPGVMHGVRSRAGSNDFVTCNLSTLVRQPEVRRRPATHAPTDPRRLQRRPRQRRKYDGIPPFTHGDQEFVTRHHDTANDTACRSAAVRPDRRRASLARHDNWHVDIEDDPVLNHW